MSMVYAKQQLVFGTGSWTPFVINYNANMIVFRNVTGAAMDFCTNQNDATTMDILNPGDQEVIDGIGQRIYLFTVGQTVCYFQATIGTGTVLATIYGQ